MSENKYRPYFSFNWKTRNTKCKKTLAYGHVDILWTYQEAKIKMMIMS